MGLDASVFAHLAGLLRVDPFFGDGWSTGDVPEPFEIRVQRFFKEKGEWRGGVGRVETRGHRFAGLFLIFSVRHVGTFNFVDKVGSYTLFLCSNDPVGHERDWPLPDAIGFRAY